jgi:predicted phosphohydrolase
MMKSILLVVCLGSVVLLSGCASGPMTREEACTRAKWQAALAGMQSGMNRQPNNPYWQERIDRICNEFQ